jgi:hypothetical protein
MSETIKQWVGSDVSQDNLDIAIHPQNSTWRVTTDESGRAELVSKLAAFNHDRGKWRGQRRIHGGRKELRSLLYMAAMCAVQHNSVFRDHYAQLLKRGSLRGLN